MQDNLNDLCPCGSGKKFKKCCGRTVGTQLPPMLDGIVITDYIQKNTYRVGSPGVRVGGLKSIGGDLSKVLANPTDYLFVLNVDLPFHIPLPEDPYPVNVLGREYGLFFRAKKRGEEEFSTLDTSKLPYFTSLQIQGVPFDDTKIKSEFDPPNKDTPTYFQSYVLIRRILRKINDFLRINTGIDYLANIPFLSYRISYVEKAPPGERLAVVIYPFSGDIEIKGPKDKLKIDNESLRNFLSESLKLHNYSERKITPRIAHKTFQEKVFITIHDFCFYCCQHPKALSMLKEDQIRDLYLVVLKTVFSYAEGEVYNFDGKLDFKITNPENKYEITTGEFKWWDGKNSLKKAFHQAVRKHSTGQEASVYIVMINRNKDVRAVFEKMIKAVVDEKECDKNSFRGELVPSGSKEFFCEYRVEIKGNRIPLRLGIANLYYENL